VLIQWHQLSGHRQAPNCLITISEILAGSRSDAATSTIFSATILVRGSLRSTSESERTAYLYASSSRFGVFWLQVRLSEYRVDGHRFLTWVSVSTTSVGSLIKPPSIEPPTAPSFDLRGDGALLVFGSSAGLACTDVSWPVMTEGSAVSLAYVPSSRCPNLAN